MSAAFRDPAGHVLVAGVNDVALGLLVALFADGNVEVVDFGAGGWLTLEVLVVLLLVDDGIIVGGLLDVLGGTGATGTALVFGVGTGTGLGVVVGLELSALLGATSLRDFSHFVCSTDIVHLRAVDIRRSWNCSPVFQFSKVHGITTWLAHTTLSNFPTTVE